MPTTKSVSFDSSFIIANLTSNTLDGNHKSAFVYTVAAIMNLKESNIVLVNESQSVGRKLSVTFVNIQHVCITASESDYSIIDQSSIEFLQFLTSLLHSAVYNGEATDVFRQRLVKMAIFDETLPVIVAVVAGDHAAFPTVSPTVLMISDNNGASNASKTTVNSALLVGVVVGLFGLICVSVPVFIFVHREAKKKKKENTLEQSPSKDINKSTSPIDRKRSITEEKLGFSLEELVVSEDVMDFGKRSISNSDNTNKRLSITSRLSREIECKVPPASENPAVVAKVDSFASPLKQINFSNYYEMLSRSTDKNLSPHNSVSDINSINEIENQDDTLLVYKESKKKTDAHFDNPMKFSNRLGSSNSQSFLVGESISQQSSPILNSFKSAVFGISDFYPEPDKYEDIADSHGNGSAGNDQDSLRFSRFLVHHSSSIGNESQQIENMRSSQIGDSNFDHNAIGIASLKSDDTVFKDSIEGDGTPSKKQHQKYDIVESVGDLFKSYKRNQNISIYDIYSDDDKYSPVRPMRDNQQPCSDPTFKVFRKATLRANSASMISASSDSHDSTGNGNGGDPSVPHSQRFRAIKIKFETMIQKNTKTLLLTPKESKNRLMSASLDRDVGTI